MIVDEHLHYFWIDRDLFFAKVNWWSVWWLVLANRIPGMRSDVFNRKAQCRIRVQDVLYQILCLLRKKTRHLVLGFNNLLVEFLCVLILERQITANHRVKDDA